MISPNVRKPRNAGDGTKVVLAFKTTNEAARWKEDITMRAQDAFVRSIICHDVSSAAE
jgi:hypothetical protein